MSVVPLLNTLLIGTPCTYTNNETIEGCTHRHVRFTIEDNGRDAHLCYVDLESCRHEQCEEEHINPALLHFEKLASKAATFLFVPHSLELPLQSSVSFGNEPHGSLLGKIRTDQGKWVEVLPHDQDLDGEPAVSDMACGEEHPLKTHICKRRMSYFILSTCSLLHIKVKRRGILVQCLAAFDMNVQAAKGSLCPLVKQGKVSRKLLNVVIG